MLFDPPSDNKQAKEIAGLDECGEKGSEQQFPPPSKRNTVTITIMAKHHSPMLAVSRS
jgi:hypothetical protein